MSTAIVARSRVTSMTRDVTQLLMAVGLVLLTSVTAWTNSGAGGRSALAAGGGSGFGDIALLFSIALVVLSLRRVLGRAKVLPGVGIDQATVLCSATVLFVSFAFVVGWLRIAPRGTGWGVLVAIVVAWSMLQIALRSLSSQAPVRNVGPLSKARLAPLSVLTVFAGAGITLAPLLTWLSIGPLSVSGYDGALHGARTSVVQSGPRLTLILAVVGAIVVAIGALRLRRQGVTDPGPKLILGHVLLLCGLAASVLPLATGISIARISGVDTGVGLWIAVAAGLLLVIVAAGEIRARDALAA